MGHIFELHSWAPHELFPRKSPEQLCFTPDKPKDRKGFHSIWSLRLGSVFHAKLSNPEEPFARTKHR